MMTAMKAEFSAIKAEIQSVTDSSEHPAKCLKDLFSIDPSDDRAALKAAKGDVIDHTCDWVLERSEFREWYASKGGLLWISGGPGLGKTMLSIYLTEHLESTLPLSEDALQSHLIYFFCDLKDGRKNNAVSILRGLMFQLIGHKRKLLEHVLPTHKIQGSHLFQEQSFDVLWKLFTTMVADSEVGPVICILDGLDECEKTSLEMLLAKFKRSSEHGFKLKTLMISREHPICLKTSLNQFSRIRLDPDAKEDVNRGLEQYISMRVGELASNGNYSVKLTEHIERTLRERSQGTYLWVSFVIKDLQTMEHCDIEAHLEKLPRGLDDYYETMLRHVPLEHQTMVRDILRWCAFAIRPLKMREMAEALGLEKTKFLTQEEVLQGKLNHCGHMVTGEYHTTPLSDLPHSEVRLVHQSAYDFLTRPRQSVDRTVPWYSLCNIEKEHADLSSVCLSYFCEKGDSAYEKREWDSVQPAFLFYAEREWPQHLQASAINGIGIFEKRTDFFKPGAPMLQGWLQKRGIYVEGPGCLIHLAVSYRLHFIMEHLLKTKSKWSRILNQDLNAGDDKWATRPLHVAASNGDLAMVKMLVVNGARVNSVDYFGTNALGFACRWNHTAVAQYLLQSGAKPSQEALKSAIQHENSGLVKELLMNSGLAKELLRKGPNSSRPICDMLSEAVWQTNESILRDIMNRCVPAEMSSWRHLGDLSILHLAAYNRSDMALRTLLEQTDWNLNVNYSDRQGETPLHYVATRRKDDGIQFARLLLEQPGIRPNAIDDQGMTPLILAITHGHSNLVKFLLREWSVPLLSLNNRGPKGEIHFAAEYGCLETLRILVQEREVNPNLQSFCFEEDYWNHWSNHSHGSWKDHCHSTPLHFATGAGKMSVIEFLLDECKIDPRRPCRGCDDASPLHAAAEACKHSVVEALIERWGADVNARNNLEQTPLHLLAKSQRYPLFEPSNVQQILRVLLKAGAQISATDSDGSTARDILLQHGQEYVPYFDGLVEEFRRNNGKD